MRLDYDPDGHATVRVSTRNLRTLIIQSGLPNSANTVISENCWRNGEQLSVEHLLVITLSTHTPFAMVTDTSILVAFSLDLAHLLVRSPGRVEVDEVTVIAERDEEHYHDRPAPPGTMHPVTELLLAIDADITAHPTTETTPDAPTDLDTLDEPA